LKVPQLEAYGSVEITVPFASKIDDCKKNKEKLKEDTGSGSCSM